MEPADDIDVGESRPLPQTEMHLSLLRLACAFDEALGRRLRTPDEMDELEHEAYQAALGAVIRYAEQNEDKEVKLNDVAGIGIASYQDRAGLATRPFDQIAPEIREKWRHLVKHIWNLLAYDGGEDGAIEQHEEQMETLFRAKLKELKETQSCTTTPPQSSTNPCPT